MRALSLNVVEIVWTQMDYRGSIEGDKLMTKQKSQRQCMMPVHCLILQGVAAGLQFQIDGKRSNPEKITKRSIPLFQDYRNYQEF